MSKQMASVSQMHPMNPAALGCKAKDVVSGFSGVITGQAVYLSKSELVLLTQVAKAGEEVKAEWFYPSCVTVIISPPVKLPRCDRQRD